MIINEELALLIQSRCPIVYFESIDEEYSIKQLQQIAVRFGLAFFQWTVTEGLRKGDRENCYYQTKQPIAVLTMIAALTKPDYIESAIFVLKDFDKYIDDAVVLRHLKDIVNKIKKVHAYINLVILSPNYKLPIDLEPDTVHFVGGYPNEEEIEQIIQQAAHELRKKDRIFQLTLTDQDRRLIVKALRGLTGQQIKNIINQCMLEDYTLNIHDLQRIESCKKDIFDQEGILEFCIPDHKHNIANLDNLKRWLTERKESFLQSEPSSKLPTPKGVLLMGVQGCGKSLAIKVIANELRLALYRLDLSKLYSKYIGETEQNLRKTLKIIEQLAPLCLWIDEIEKVFAASGGDIDGGVSQRILGTFLTWMQERKAPCFIAATANNIYQLPPEFLRKGRFDEIFFVDLPDTATREHIFRIHLFKRNLDVQEFDCKLLAQTSVDFNGAEIEQVIIAALYSATNKQETVTTRHIIEQLHSTKPLSVIKREEIIALRAWAKERTIPA